MRSVAVSRLRLKGAPQSQSSAIANLPAFPLRYDPPVPTAKSRRERETEPIVRAAGRVGGRAANGSRVPRDRPRGGAKRGASGSFAVRDGWKLRRTIPGVRNGPDQLVLQIALADIDDLVDEQVGNRSTVQADGIDGCRRGSRPTVQPSDRTSGVTNEPFSPAAAIFRYLLTLKSTLQVASTSPHRQP
jgi:hypothetical protein